MTRDDFGFDAVCLKAGNASDPRHFSSRCHLPRLLDETGSLVSRSRCLKVSVRCSNKCHSHGITTRHKALFLFMISPRATFQQVSLPRLRTWTQESFFFPLFFFFGRPTCCLMNTPALCAPSGSDVWKFGPSRVSTSSTPGKFTTLPSTAS